MVGPVSTAFVAALSWFLQGRVTPPAQAPTQILVPLLYAVVAGQWVATFVLETVWKRRLLACLPQRPQQDAALGPFPPENVRPVLISGAALFGAMGDSIAVYGLVLVLLGLPFKAVLPFFVIAAAHLILFRFRYRRMFEALRISATGLPPSIG